ncbi:alpha/beta hydrolase [Sphingomonas sp.]|uniref:alpha/beta fold hydrolase n=1 Tax=Sphingomonas sp. TaxID=28214 RepID=UPI002869FA3A|nr:alpha/beta hydrolase [Sphingomonas sp.]
MPIPPSIILLPGNMCDERLWRGESGAIVNTLGARAPVRDADFSRDDSIAAMAARTLEAIPGPIIAIGFSMGAIVAVEMWVQAPERIAGLVLLGYNATADLPERSAHRPRQQAEAHAGGLERLLADELKPNYLAAAHRGDTALLDLLLDMGMRLGPEVFVRQSEALRMREDRRAALGRITVPVLLGCGVEDTLCPPAWHADWAARIPDATLFTVPGAGHMLPLEAPLTLARHLDEWLTAKDIA